MIERFYPKHKVERIQDIKPNMLGGNKIKGVILDIDNTLVAEHVAEPDNGVVEWIEGLKRAGLKVCIVSNASQKRVLKFNERLKVCAIHNASKPSKKGFIKAAGLMNIKIQETAVIGDQIFTDIYGGNRLNMFTILVKPIDPREIFFVRVKRIAEKFVLARYEGFLSKEKE